MSNSARYRVLVATQALTMMDSKDEEPKQMKLTLEAMEATVRARHKKIQELRETERHTRSPGGRPTEAAGKLEEMEREVVEEGTARAP